MKKKNIFCTACLLISPILHASGTASANITLHIPEQARIVIENPTQTEQRSVNSVQGFFCVGDTSGLQFLVVSDVPEALPDMVVSPAITRNDLITATPNSDANECHERNSGVLQITQLPQGTRTITAVVVTE